MAGLEPADAGVKVPCLTTWLHPNTREVVFSHTQDSTNRTGHMVIVHALQLV